jgi:hypothetical protein
VKDIKLAATQLNVRDGIFISWIVAGEIDIVLTCLLNYIIEIFLNFDNSNT